MATGLLISGLLLGGIGIGFSVKTVYDGWFQERQRRYDISAEQFERISKEEAMRTALKNEVITADEYIAFMEKEKEE
mgnify:CR=1 FL=1